MSRFTLATIVEGHGEIEALPILLRNILPSHWQIERPVLWSKGMMKRVGGMVKPCSFAVTRIKKSKLPGAVLVLLDADDDCPAELGPNLRQQCRSYVSDKIPVEVAIVKRAFETWILAGNAVESPHLPDVETIHNPKKIIENIRRTYSETVDQPKLTAKINIETARQKSRSFAKFLEKLDRMKHALETRV